MASSASGRAAVTPVQRFAQVVGALWLASSRTESSARAVSTLIGAVYTA